MNRGFEFRQRLAGDAAGARLIEYLILRFSRFTREEWMKRIASGRVRLDGIPANGSECLRAGQVLSWMRAPWEEPDVPLDYAILYRDEDLLAVAKPAGLPTLPGGGLFMDNTLLARVRRHFPAAAPLHRLGRGTSGIVLFAVNPEAAANVSRLWRGGHVLKVYRALAAGIPSEDEFEVTTRIGSVPHPILKSVHGACAAGKPAHSRVLMLERRAACSLLQVTITTGRPHQIRIHLAAAGHPLVGDPLYGIGGVPAPNSRALPGDLGYHLHNALLGFRHPTSGDWTEIHCMPPPLLRSEAERRPPTITT